MNESTSGTTPSDSPLSLTLWDLERDCLNVGCPGCGFSFDCCHEDDKPDPQYPFATVQYTCPVCGIHGTLSGADAAVVAAKRAKRVQP